jgi:transposase
MPTFRNILHRPLTSPMSLTLRSEEPSTTSELIETTKEILFEAWAGLDVHQKTAVASRTYKDQQGKQHTDKQTFPPLTRDLLRLSDWLAQANITHIAMESTGDYWKAPYSLFEGNVEIWIVSAHHVNVPGGKTDVGEATQASTAMAH